MKYSFLVYFLFSLILFACSDDPVTSGDDMKNEELQKMIDSLANYYHTQRNITDGGFLIKINTPSGNYLSSSGINPVVEGNSHLRIASISKTFTAAAIMLLHQQGKINIYDYITSNLPGTNIPYTPDSPDYDVPFKDQITLKLLLEHRAGVFDITNSKIPVSVQQPYAGMLYVVYIEELPGNEFHTFTFDELVGVAAVNEISYFPPGQEYHYSNTGYNILGKIIERVSGMSFTEFIETNFFQPYNLNNTTAPVLGNDETIPAPFIGSIFYNEGKVINTTLQNMSPHVSEGNINSTPDDITKWITLLLTGQAGINMNNVELMKQVLPTGQTGLIDTQYGLGISYIEGLGYGHNGAHLSYLLSDFYNPETGVTVFVAANFWDFEIVLNEANGIAEFAINAVKVVQ
ncbi:MAG: serine hydrolase domain-containing protein [Ignavibacteria bacterium]